MVPMLEESEHSQKLAGGCVEAIWKNNLNRNYFFLELAKDLTGEHEDRWTGVNRRTG